MTIKEDTKIVWITGWGGGKYCAACGAVKGVEDHKKSCSYRKILK